MEIRRNGSQASLEGPDDWFTSKARIDPLFLKSTDLTRITGAGMTFEPGTRTAGKPNIRTISATGNGEYRTFAADKSENEKEELMRCFRCHKSEAHNDYVFTFEAMKNSHSERD